MMQAVEFDGMLDGLGDDRRTREQLVEKFLIKMTKESL